MWPVAGYGITTKFKKRGPYWSTDQAGDPLRKVRRGKNGKPGWGIHTGGDISGKNIAGKPIVSATPGKVIAANAYDKAYGYKVIIRWGNYDVWYCHMPKNAARVKAGQVVAAGQRIGSVGSTGNVSGPHLHLELRVKNGGFALGNFRDPMLAINYNPTPKPGKPASRGPWFEIGSYNLKSPTLTRSGKHKWTLRRSLQVANVKAGNLDVLGTQETGSPTDVTWYDKAFGGIGLKRVAGSQWRYIWINPKTTKFITGGTVELQPLYEKDDKEMAWAALEINGSYALVGNWHLEEANGTKPDEVRPDQATDGVRHLDRIAARLKQTHGITIARDRYFIVGDTNSEGKVTTRMRGHGFLSALTNALKSNGGYIATFNNWLAARIGKHIDFIYVDTTRPVEEWEQKADSVASDHNFIHATVGRKA